MTHLMNKSLEEIEKTCGDLSADQIETLIQEFDAAEAPREKRMLLARLYDAKALRRDADRLTANMSAEQKQALAQSIGLTGVDASGLTGKILQE